MQIWKKSLSVWKLAAETNNLCYAVATKFIMSSNEDMLYLPRKVKTKSPNMALELYYKQDED